MKNNTGFSSLSTKITAGFALAIILIFFAAYEVWDLVATKLWIQGGPMGDAGSFMQGVFGSAVSLAGSFVAIILASIALNLQKEQKEREDARSHFEILRFVETWVQQGLKPMAEVGRVGTNVYVSATRLDSYIEIFIKKYLPRTVNVASVVLTADMKKDLDSLRKNCTQSIEKEIAGLAKALEDCMWAEGLPVRYLFSTLQNKIFTAHEIDNLALGWGDLDVFVQHFHTKAIAIAELNSLDDDKYLTKLVEGWRETYSGHLDPQGNVDPKSQSLRMELTFHLALNLGFPLITIAQMLLCQHSTEEFVKAISPLFPEEPSGSVIEVIRFLVEANSKGLPDFSKHLPEDWLSILAPLPKPIVDLFGKMQSALIGSFYQKLSDKEKAEFDELLTNQEFVDAVKEFVLGGPADVIAAALANQKMTDEQAAEVVGKMVEAVPKHALFLRLLADVAVKAGKNVAEANGGDPEAVTARMKKIVG